MTPEPAIARVLVVDDDAENRALAKAALEDDVVPVVLFERFMTAGPGPTRTNRGLGLAFCKVAVEAHGGRIRVEDAAPGAAFCMRLDDAA